MPVANHAWRLPPCAEFQNQTLPKTQNNTGAVHILITLEPQQLVVFVGCEKMKKTKTKKNFEATGPAGKSSGGGWKAGGEQKFQLQRVPGLSRLAEGASTASCCAVWQLATSRHSRHLCLPSRGGSGWASGGPGDLAPPPNSVWPASQDDLRPGLKLQGLSLWGPAQAKKEEEKKKLLTLFHYRRKGGPHAVNSLALQFLFILLLYLLFWFEGQSTQLKFPC